MSQTIFDPVGARPRLFFMHIPKTSGSRQNALIRELWGEDALVHAESWFHPIRTGRHAPMRADAVSGHIAFASWRAQGLDRVYPGATVLRDPWQRLVSHINWMDRFNHGVDSETRARLSQSHARIVEALAETDFDAASSLKRLVTRLTDAGDHGLFDNLQVRMSLPEPPAPGASMAPEDSAAAIQVLRGFVLVGDAERQGDFTRALARIASARVPSPAADVPVNPARSGRMRADNLAARAALSGWWQQDATLRAAILPGRSPVHRLAAAASRGLHALRRR
ncbi:hypothetical protein [Roseivivax marinus]|uniref:hypothetical protein n=1 Tax=Roseivivax marinus TaxID=1379903 RepID=UPI00273D851B|nr:hypothetical protein [Roseivivax marinus]